MDIISQLVDVIYTVEYVSLLTVAIMSSLLKNYKFVINTWSTENLYQI